MRVKIIAEIGVNHSGDVTLAKQMIDEAKLAGADAVKFQTFTAEKLVSDLTPKVKYQESTTLESESHYEMIKSLEFAYEDHLPVLEYCRENGVEFISTPYDVESAEFLVSIGVKTFKTASADIVDLSLQTFIAQNANNAIVSTGMATLGEIEKVVAIYRKYNCPLTLLHCVSNYPCAYESLNLKSMKTLRSAFQCNVGYSDHAIGPIPAVAAVAMGATIIEKHFTLDKNMIGPDHQASSEPEEFKELVDAIRTTEILLGTPFKRIQSEETQMRNVSRKSLFFRENVVKGEILKAEHFTLKRPGDGLFESELENIIGCKATISISAGKKLSYGDFCSA
ncbi:N-acetylneuraminate synthase family protein [Vibrio sp. VB16]|uniref:N-acetylneuraminate synthase family protein n=1 Tax=Vibrio sp. VB16 TaxID=2785746 RepID=UPI00189D7FEA|nr:N-acetylneuraminate synthase family protein [Vibrio sp. VB16]UGA57363.1 N-acetylneuraminate synthase family protein [Vibrio sp. VB16]